jgi:cytochrome P450
MERIENLPEAEKSDFVRESLIYKILSSKDHLGFQTKEEGAYLSLMLTIGSADTSQISTWAFLEAMITYPPVQRKAQQLIDQVVGLDRVPCWEDYAGIPYVRCLVKETWRWRPPVGLGHPHVTTFRNRLQWYEDTNGESTAPQRLGDPT